MSKNPPTPQKLEADKAKTRIEFYLTGGSQLVYASRWVVSGIVIAFWFAIWLRGLG
jgi:hypothetical protein